MPDPQNQVQQDNLHPDLKLLTSQEGFQKLTPEAQKKAVSGVVSGYELLSPAAQKAFLDAHTSKPEPKPADERNQIIQQQLQARQKSATPAVTVPASGQQPTMRISPPVTKIDPKNFSTAIEAEQENPPIKKILGPIENYTQEGRKEHPILATIGDFAKKAGDYYNIVSTMSGLLGGPGEGIAGAGGLASGVYAPPSIDPAELSRGNTIPLIRTPEPPGASTRAPIRLPEGTQPNALLGPPKDLVERGLGLKYLGEHDGVHNINIPGTDAIIEVPGILTPEKIHQAVVDRLKGSLEPGETSASEESLKDKLKKAVKGEEGWISIGKTPKAFDMSLSPEERAEELKKVKSKSRFPMSLFTSPEETWQGLNAKEQRNVYTFMRNDVQPKVEILHNAVNHYLSDHPYLHSMPIPAIEDRLNIEYGPAFRKISEMIPDSAKASIATHEASHWVAAHLLGSPADANMYVSAAYHPGTGVAQLGIASIEPHGFGQPLDLSTKAGRHYIAASLASTPLEKNIFGDYALGPDMVSGRASDIGEAYSLNEKLKENGKKPVSEEAVGRLLGKHQAGLDRVSHYLTDNWGRKIPNDELVNVFNNADVRKTTPFSSGPPDDAGYDRDVPKKFGPDVQKQENAYERHARELREKEQRRKDAVKKENERNK